MPPLTFFAGGKRREGFNEEVFTKLFSDFNPKSDLLQWEWEKERTHLKIKIFFLEPTEIR